MQQGLACEQLQNSVCTLCYETVHLPVWSNLLWATAADGTEGTEHAILCVQWYSASAKAVERYTVSVPYVTSKTVINTLIW